MQLQNDCICVVNNTNPQQICGLGYTGRLKSAKWTGHLCWPLKTNPSPRGFVSRAPWQLMRKHGHIKAATGAGVDIISSCSVVYQQVHLRRGHSANGIYLLACLRWSVQCLLVWRIIPSLSMRWLGPQGFPAQGLKQPPPNTAVPPLWHRSLTHTVCTGKHIVCLSTAVLSPLSLRV